MSISQLEDVRQTVQESNRLVNMKCMKICFKSTILTSCYCWSKWCTYRLEYAMFMIYGTCNLGVDAKILVEIDADGKFVDHIVNGVMSFPS